MLKQAEFQQFSQKSTEFQDEDIPKAFTVSY